MGIWVDGKTEAGSAAVVQRGGPHREDPPSFPTFQDNPAQAKPVQFDKRSLSVLSDISCPTRAHTSSTAIHHPHSSSATVQSNHHLISLSALPATDYFVLGTSTLAVAIYQINMHLGSVAVALALSLGSVWANPMIPEAPSNSPGARFDRFLARAEIFDRSQIFARYCLNPVHDCGAKGGTACVCASGTGVCCSNYNPGCPNPPKNNPPPAAPCPPR